MFRLNEKCLLIKCLINKENNLHFYILKTLDKIKHFGLSPFFKNFRGIPMTES